MDYIKSMEKRFGVDIGYHQSNLHPKNGEGCIGKCGLDKTLSLIQIIEIAHKMEIKPNIIIKGGPNAKWYLKSFPSEQIEEGIQKQQWRDTSRATMWIIEWDNI